MQNRSDHKVLLSRQALEIARMNAAKRKPDEPLLPHRRCVQDADLDQCEGVHWFRGMACEGDDEHAADNEVTLGQCARRTGLRSTRE